jgi:DNA-binding LytR/AlgR family response regulator
MQLKVVIIEDEHHNYRMLRGMVEQFRPDWEIIGPFESVNKSVTWFKENPEPDLIFMDIQLVDGISFSIFEQVKIDSMVIFTTAYDEYALQAFNVNSIDYILKPVKEIKLQEAIMKFEKFHDNKQQNTIVPDYKEMLNAIVRGEKKYRKRFLIAGATSYSKIDTKDIALFYTENRITYAVTFDGKEHTLDLTMEKLDEQLDPEVFFRASRSYIIHNDAIQKIESYFGGKLYIKMTSPIKHEITISRLKATEFKNWLGK